MSDGAADGGAADGGAADGGAADGGAADGGAADGGPADGGQTSGREAVLRAALQAVTVDRAATHGDAERTFGRLAALWSALLGRDVSPAQVALLLATLKVARAWGNPDHDDNWVDLAGYAACGGELAAAKGAMRDVF